MFNTNNGEISQFNPSKDIAREVTLQIIIKHRDATAQAREGVIPGVEVLGDKQKKYNKIKGLFKMISSQREMINISRPAVLHNCMAKWNRRSEDNKKPFEEEENEYNDLMVVREILQEAELDMTKAEQSKTVDDDYLIEKQRAEGVQYILTEKYFEMINGLEDLYEKIYLIMLKHKIVSSGIEVDEIKTYKETEDEAIRRIVEA